MRITSGEFRGRNIESPAGYLTHPMGDREKLALFNSLVGLGVDFDAVSSVLDCFCGSGALGLEALSRGARQACFVDNSSKAIDATKKNIASLGVSDRAEVKKCSAKQFIEADEEKFDLILLDPPYDHFDASEFKGIEKLLNNDGFLVLSHPDGVKVDIPGLSLVSQRKYAAANIAIYH